jgi:hypothetical protein
MAGHPMRRSKRRAGLGSSKWLRRCRKSLKLSTKECKEIQHMRTNNPQHHRVAKIKACAKSDRGVRQLVGRIWANKLAASEGDGSGAEDRFFYNAEGLQKTLQIRCGAAFAKRAVR